MPAYLVRALVLLILAVLLAACGTGPSAAAPAATPAPATAVATHPDVLAGYEAAWAGDFARAAELLGPFAASDPTVAEMLATVRLGYAMQSLTEYPGNGAVARAALDQVQLGLAIAAAPELRDTLSATQGALLALLAVEDARMALDGLVATGAAPGAISEQASELADRSGALLAVAPPLPGAGQVAIGGIVAAAGGFEAVGTEAGRAAAQDLCSGAALVAPDDPAVLACVGRLGAGTAGAAAEAPAPTAQAAQAPRPTARPRPPAAPAYSVAQRKSFDGSGNSGQYNSCVDVQILGPAGPVSGAVIGINNGEHSYQNQTDANGYTGRCGLGASTWSVVLFWTPAGSVKGAATTVYVSGAPEQRAAVVFQGR